MWCAQRAAAGWAPHHAPTCRQRREVRTIAQKSVGMSAACCVGPCLAGGWRRPGSRECGACCGGWGCPRRFHWQRRGEGGTCCTVACSESGSERTCCIFGRSGAVLAFLIVIWYGASKPKPGGGCWPACAATSGGCPCKLQCQMPPATAATLLHSRACGASAVQPLQGAAGLRQRQQQLCTLKPPPFRGLGALLFTPAQGPWLQAALTVLLGGWRLQGARVQLCSFQMGMWDEDPGAYDCKVMILR